MKSIETARLRELLHYNPETGTFTRRVSAGGRLAGSVAGNIDISNGYVRIGIDNRRHYAHRLAYQYVYGEVPPTEIDHVNGDRVDNRICNLRLATRSENNMNSVKRVNNTSGVVGVSWNKARSKWMAFVTHERKKIYLGIFDTIEEASAVRDAKARDLYGEFYRHRHI